MILYIGCAITGARRAGLVAQPDDLADLPAVVVGETPVAGLATGDDVAHRLDALDQRRVAVAMVHVVDVDIVGVEAASGWRRSPSSIHLRERPCLRCGGPSCWPTLVASTQLSRSLAISLPSIVSEAPVVVGVGRVDEIDLGLARGLDHLLGRAMSMPAPKSIVPRQMRETRSPLLPRYV